MSSIDMDTVIRTLFPEGSVWEPKEFTLTDTGSVELVTNGEFDSDITGWTNSSLPNGDITWTAAGGGRMLLDTQGPA